MTNKSQKKASLAGIKATSLTFRTQATAGALPREFYFIIKDNELVKWGDGTFGVVYEVRQSDADNMPYVVKLLYASKAGQDSKLSRDDLETIKREFEQELPRDEQKREKRLKFLYELLDTPASYLEMIDKLLARSNPLSTQQTNDLYNALNKAAASSARDRFQEEILATKQLTSALDKDPGLVIKNVIRIVGGTQEFLKSDAGTKLQEYFTSKGYQISNYALVMERYEYTLKRLLERKLDRQFQVSLTLRAEEAIRKLGATPSALKRRFEDMEDVDQVRTEFGGDLERQFSAVGSDKRFTDDNSSSTAAKGPTDINSEKRNEEFQAIKKGILKDLEIRQLTGYDLLAALDFTGRLKAILPIIMQTAQGIKALHTAGLYHRDLKPANIYLKKYNDYRVELVVGDLGFLDVKSIPDEDSTEGKTSVLAAAFLEAIPRGTRHYRSPEQKDYFDLCDAKVNVNDQVVTLTVSDPKFKDTIIHKGDVAVFSKDENTRFPVINIEGQKNRAGEIKITLAGKDIKDDERTQVFFFKQQKAKTDIFGLGAIAYDLVTCGDSPERFYDKIRNLDTWESSVDKIMTEYEKLSNLESPEQSYLSMFEAFKHEGSSTYYAPPAIVKFILSCMLYRADGTYCGPFGTENDKAIDKALRDLRELADMDEYSTREFTTNPLIEGKPKANEEQAQTKTLLQIMNELQEMTPGELVRRILDGYTYLKALYDIVYDSCTENTRKYLIQMRPDKIRYTSERGGALETLQATAYRSREEYESDLAIDYVYSRITRSLSNPFVPDYLAFMRREITLARLGDGSSPAQWRYKINFPDSSWLSDKVREGDWLRINNIIYRIQEHNGREVELDKDPEQDSDILKGVYYRDLNSLEYYFQVLGIFLYQLFFAGLGTCTRNKPSTVHVAQSLHLLDNSVLQLADNDQDLTRVNPLEYVYLELARIYLRLMLTDYDFSYFQQDLDRETDKLWEFDVDLKKRLKPALDQWIGERYVDTYKIGRMLDLPEEKLRELEKDARTLIPSLDIEKCLLYWLDFQGDFADVPIRKVFIPQPKSDHQQDSPLLLPDPLFELRVSVVGPGTVDIWPKKGVYKPGEKVELTARGIDEKKGFFKTQTTQFKHWSSNDIDLGQNTEISPLFIEIDKDIEVIAHFEGSST